MQAMATRPTPMPASLKALAASPNSRKAASSDTISANRCAASLRTMPAWRTEAASARKITGSSRPRPTKPIHGAPGRASASSEGWNTQAVSALVAT